MRAFRHTDETEYAVALEQLQIPIEAVPRGDGVADEIELAEVALHLGGVGRSTTSADTQHVYDDVAQLVSAGARNVAVTASATRYEDSEFAYALVVGLGAAVRYALAQGLEPSAARAWTLATDMRERLRYLGM
jgi:hypothetical protein